MDKFSSWLKSEEDRAVEVATDTGQIASFARIAIPGCVMRMFPEPITLTIGKEEEKRKKRKKHGKSV